MCWTHDFSFFLSHLDDFESSLVPFVSSDLIDAFVVVSLSTCPFRSYCIPDATPVVPPPLVLPHRMIVSEVHHHVQVFLQSSTRPCSSTHRHSPGDCNTAFGLRSHYQPTSLDILSAILSDRRKGQCHLLPDRSLPQSPVLMQ